MKIYFAHPINVYSTPLEAAVEALIALELAGGDLTVIENPNQARYEAEYQAIAKRERTTERDASKVDGMRVFTEKVLPSCTHYAGLSFLDGLIGAGVAMEAAEFFANGRPAYFVEPTCMPSSSDLEAFIANPLNGLFRVRPFTPREAELIVKGDPALVVPRIQTRLRTWKVYNKVKLSYEEAHLAPTKEYEGFYPEEAKK